MSTRYLEYVTYNGGLVSLYIVQDHCETEELCYHVSLRNGRELVTVSLIKQVDHWKIITPEAPAWVKELESLISKIVEEKISEAKTMADLDSSTV